VTTTSNYPITVDGVRLDTLAYGVVLQKLQAPAMRDGAGLIPGTHGLAPSYDQDYEAAVFGLSMVVIGADVNGVVPTDSVGQLRDNLDMLLHLFSKVHAPLDVQQVVKTGVTRQALCQRLDSIEPELVPGLSAQFSVSLRIPSAFWQDVSTQDWAQNSAVSGTTYEVTTLAGATAPLQDGIYLVTGPATNPRLTDPNTGEWVQYTGSVAAGSQWRVNAGTFASRVGAGLTLGSADTAGTDAMGATTFSQANRFLTSVPTLLTGTRRTQLVLTGTGFTVATALGVRARRKYIG
jgi:hypothetical protein